MKISLTCGLKQNYLAMIELPKNFRAQDIDEFIDAEFNPVINYTRIQSYDGEMYFTETKVYLMPHYVEHALIFHGKCFEYSEVESYKRKLIAGYEITLKDGNKILLSNVFGKMREGITAAFDSHINK